MRHSLEFGRFLNMKVDLYNFVSALNCVLAQRLVRKICDHCKRETTYTEKTLTAPGLGERVLARRLVRKTCDRGTRETTAPEKQLTGSGLGELLLGVGRLALAVVADLAH